MTWPIDEGAPPTDGDLETAWEAGAEGLSDLAVCGLILEIRRVRTMAREALKESVMSGEVHWLRTLAGETCEDPDCGWQAEDWHP